MSGITEKTRCACGDTFEHHAGHHDNSIGGDGTWIDLGCQLCPCPKFEEAVGDAPAGMTEAQWRFVTLDRRKAEYKQFLEEYKAATEALIAEQGVGTFFKDEQGVVYQTAEAEGRFVYYERHVVNRTRREGEAKGTLSMKAAREAGFTVEG